MFAMCALVPAEIIIKLKIVENQRPTDTFFIDLSHMPHGIKRTLNCFKPNKIENYKII